MTQTEHNNTNTQAPLFGFGNRSFCRHLAVLLVVLSTQLPVTGAVYAQDAGTSDTGSTDIGATDTGSTDGTGNDVDPCNEPVSPCSQTSTSTDLGPVNPQPSTSIGNPISLVTGNKNQTEQDYFVSGSSLAFSRHYNSARSDYSTGVGRGWSTTYGSKIKALASGGYVITDSSGRAFIFNQSSDNQDGTAYFRTSSATNGHVWRVDNTSFWLMPDGKKLTFQGSFLVRIDHPGQQSLALFYRNKKLVQVTDEAGRTLQFEYYQAGLSEYSENAYREIPGYLKRLVLPDNTTIEYDYDDNFNLARARFTDDTSTVYHYEDEAYPNHLTGVTDRLGHRYASWEYNGDGLAASSEHAGGVERVTLDYVLPERDEDVGTTYVTNSQGAMTTYRWQRIRSTGDILLLSSEGPGCATCPPSNMLYTYAPDYKLSSSTDAAGNELHYYYDDKGRIERLERTSIATAAPMLVARYEYEGNGLKPVRLFKPSVNGDGEYQQAIEYTEDNLPAQITEFGFAPTVPSAAGRLAALYKPVSRTTQLSYEAGRLSEVDGPRDDVDDITRFRYDQLGRLAQMELASGEVIAINKYDEHGRAVEFRRAEDPTVTMHYDHNGNVDRITRLGKSVEYQYNAENKLVRVTNPNGKTSTLSYDEAQRLKSVSDDLGRTVELVVNNESQIQDRTFLGVNGALIRSLNYVFDAESRIQSVTEEKPDNTNGSTLSRTIDLEYDAFGQVTGSRDSSSGAAQSYIFNTLGSLLETIQPNGLSVKQEYDVHNRLISQVDKRFNTTQYHRDDFGLVHFLVSPDTGVTQYQYDASGNRIEKSNANGEVTQYRWDAANRIVEQQDIDGQTTYTYDGTSGRLLETTNPYTTESYTYTTLAQLQTHTRNIDGHAFTTKYVYEGDGKLAKKILPDGQTLRYHYYESGPNADTLRAITRETLLGLSQSTLLAEVDLDWRNGQTSFLSHNGRRNEYRYHADGKVASLSVLDTLTLEYEYDENGNIVGIRQDGFDQRYGYSAGQLSDADTQTGKYNYRYDVTGNRTLASSIDGVGKIESTLNYGSATKGNRLASSIDKQTGEEVVYRYNDAGSPVKIGDLRYEYNTNQRPITVTRDGNVIAEYDYNSFGERIKKVTYSQNQKKVTYFLYDNRTLVAEIDGDTLAYRQTVYLKHTPVAHLIGKAAFAVHTDNLGTPKVLTNNDGEAVWEAAHTPLGLAVIETQDIQFNLRFPGQYADAETGTHYNYLRDYDPRTGRYLTSDPVGLEGGANTYAYANNNVLSAIDALGLSSQLVGIPGLATDAASGQAFSLDNDSNAAPNPSTLPPDAAEFGITDPNQLVNGFLTVGSICQTDGGLANFNIGIDRAIGRYPDHLLDRSDIDNIIRIARGPNGTGLPPNPANLVLAATLDQFTGFDDSSLLLIPHCASDAAIGDIVRGALGKLVHQSEIDAMIAGMEAPGADGCRQPQIVDVTDLHEEVLLRFQVRLSTDQRVLDAERDLILAQAEFDEFNRLGNPCETESQPHGRLTPNCNKWLDLQLAISDAAERLANVLDAVYDEQIANGLMPQHDVDAAASATRTKIMIGIVGVFIPLTAGDLALEAATLGFSRVMRLFSGIADVASAITRGTRAGINNLIADGSEVFRRALALKKRKYDSYEKLSGLEYDDLVRIEGELGTLNLRALENQIAANPGLASALNVRPAGVSASDVVNQWKKLDAHPSLQTDPNTLHMMAKLENDIPVGKGPAASRVAATDVNGNPIQSDRTFYNLGRNHLRDRHIGPGGVLEEAKIVKNPDGTFVINDRAKYMEWVEKEYADSGNVLNADTRAMIESQLGAPGKVFDNQAGLPGMHAEVQAVNDIYNKAGGAANVQNVNVSTIRVESAGDFPACSNCGSILSGENITIITGIR